MYLGLLLGARTRASSVWDPVVKKFERKLFMWKGRCLSLGGRITLIKACLSSLPIYYMSLFKMPKAVSLRLDKIRRDFLWEGQSERRKIHPLKWSDVIKPKSAWGLGLGELETHNWSLPAKWW